LHTANGSSGQKGGLKRNGQAIRSGEKVEQIGEKKKKKRAFHGGGHQMLLHRKKAQQGIALSLFVSENMRGGTPTNVALAG